MPTGAEPLIVQLKWRHQFQFAGYYMAQAKGHYRAAGLEVALRANGEGGIMHSPGDDEQLLTQVDLARYQAKTLGRNRVECYGNQPRPV